MEQGKTVSIELCPHSHTLPPILASKGISGSVWLAAGFVFFNVNPGIGRAE